LIGDNKEIRLFQDTYRNGEYKKRQVLSDEDVKRETRKALSLGISEIIFRVEFAQEEEQLDDGLKIRALTTSDNNNDGEEKRKKTRMLSEPIFHESSIESEEIYSVSGGESFFL
jgi:hypothetical protein